MNTFYRFADFTLDRPGYRLLNGDQVVPLTPKLLDLLICLLESAGDLVTKETLLDTVWPDVNVSDNALAQAVSELRRALGDDTGSPTFIKTVARRGYRFVAPVFEVETAPTVSPAGTLIANRTAASAGPSEAGPAVPRAVAVLDFANVTADPETAWLSAGIAETVTGDLRALGHLRVVDRRRVIEATAMRWTRRGGQKAMASASRSWTSSTARWNPTWAGCPPRWRGRSRADCAPCPAPHRGPAACGGGGVRRGNLARSRGASRQRGLRGGRQRAAAAIPNPSLGSPHQHQGCRGPGRSARGRHDGRAVHTARSDGDGVRPRPGHAAPQGQPVTHRCARNAQPRRLPRGR